MVLAYPYQDPLVLLLEHLVCSPVHLALVRLALPSLDPLDRLGTVELVRLELGYQLDQPE